MRLFLAISIAALAACGGNPTAPSEQVLCTEVDWTFRIDSPDGLRFPTTSLTPGKTIVLTLSSLYISTDRQSRITGACLDQVSSIIWESTAPEVADVRPVGGQRSEVTALSAGTADITARFVVAGVTPQSTWIRVTVTR
jgi:hypothetical protein